MALAGARPPVLTVLAVVATANHWWLDGVVAAMILGVAYLVVRLIEAAWQRARSAWQGTAAVEVAPPPVAVSWKLTDRPLPTIGRRGG